MTILANRLQKNLKKYKSLIKNYETDSYRLYHKDIPEIPYYIDIYQDIALVYEKGKRDIEPEKQLSQQAQIQDALKQVLGFDSKSIFFKIRQIQKGHDQYQSKHDNALQNSTDNNIESNDYYAFEGKAKFIIKPDKYLDSGLFLDHRKLRKKFFSQSKDQSILNLFCYTGSFSIQALLGGAKDTVNIDMSNTYLNWSAQNAELNNIPSTSYQNIKANVLEWLKTASHFHESFDKIILDPPSFSNSKNMRGSFDVQRDHDFLVRQTMKFLKPDGVLYFSNNKEKFEISETLTKEFKIKDITKWSTSMDFERAPLHKCFEITL